MNRCPVPTTKYNIGDAETHREPCGIELKEGRCSLHDPDTDGEVPLKPSDTKFGVCSACGSFESHHLEYVRTKGVCVS